MLLRAARPTHLPHQLQEGSTPFIFGSFSSLGGWGSLPVSPTTWVSSSASYGVGCTHPLLPLEQDPSLQITPPWGTLAFSSYCGFLLSSLVPPAAHPPGGCIPTTLGKCLS